MIAVLLLAFGCPDSPESIEPFITNVMGGRKPSPEQLQKIKERYLMIGGRSPLLDITQRQAEALERLLNSEAKASHYSLNKGKPAPASSKQGGHGTRGKELKVFVGMRHWHPFIKDTLKEILDSGARKIIAIIMTPHHSRFSADGYIKALNEAKSELLSISPPYIRGSEMGLNISFVESWHTHPLFLEAVSDEIKKWRVGVRAGEGVQVIFSAHSLPVNEGRGEELYVKHLNETIQGIIKLTGDIAWHLGFQSKGMSPGKWLEPTVDSIIERLSKDGKKYVLLVPVGFVSDHIETLYDIDIVYKNIAESLGMKFHRTNSLNDSPKFIEALSDIVIEHFKISSISQNDLSIHLPYSFQYE